MDPDAMKKRTKEFAKAIIGVCRRLPRTQEAWLIRGQLFRCGTSVGVNYRAACRARSHADFVSKMGIVLEEADETLYWLELIAETRMLDAGVVDAVMVEANQLVSIFVASLNTAKERR